MPTHCCRMMSLYVEEESHLHPGRLVHFDEQQKTYELADPAQRPGKTVPISYCPWCSTKLRRVLAKGLRWMSPERCRAARHALSMTHREVAECIGESLETVFGCEAGKPTDEAVVTKLLAYFQEFRIFVDRSGRIGSYQL